MTGDWNLRNIENWLYCWISQLEISADAYFQLFNSTIALLDIEFDPIFPVFNQTGGWNLKNIRKLYRWVSHPEISVNTYFQHYSSIALLNSKFWPHFPRVWADIGMWRHNLKNIKKMTSLLDFPSKNWSTCKFLTFWLECKTRNDDFFYQFFRKLREKYERWGTPCCEITYHFQNFYHHFLTTLRHVLTYSGVKTFGPRRIYGISG